MTGIKMTLQTPQAVTQEDSQATEATATIIHVPEGAQVSQFWIS